MCATIIYAQKTDYKPIEKAFDTNSFEKVKSFLAKIETTKISSYDKAIWLYHYANYNFNIDQQLTKTMFESSILFTMKYMYKKISWTSCLGNPA